MIEGEEEGDEGGEGDARGYRQGKQHIKRPNSRKTNNAELTEGNENKKEKKEEGMIPMCTRTI